MQPLQRIFAFAALPVFWSPGGPVSSLHQAGDPASSHPTSETLFAQTRTQQTGTQVGTIRAVMDGETRVFRVMEGPVTRGFATGWNQQPRGGTMVLGASLLGDEEGSDAQMSIRLGVARDSGAQWCDPFSNLVEFLPAGDRAGRNRLREGGTSSSACPDLPLDVNVTEADFDEDRGTLHLKGTFSGPMGRGEDAIQVTRGEFEATLHSMDSLMGG